MENHNIEQGVETTLALSRLVSSLSLFAKGESGFTSWRFAGRARDVEMFRRRLWRWSVFDDVSRKVSREEGIALAYSINLPYGVPYYETSSKENYVY